MTWPHLPPCPLNVHACLITLAFLLYLRQDKLLSKCRGFAFAISSAQDVPPPEIPVSHSNIREAFPHPFLVWSGSPPRALLPSLFLHFFIILLPRAILFVYLFLPTTSSMMKSLESSLVCLVPLSSHNRAYSIGCLEWKGWNECLTTGSRCAPEVL